MKKKNEFQMLTHVWVIKIVNPGWGFDPQQD